ncbi:MAG: hypothetical protein IT557_14130 [Alphaproteobacteria bacterium]|nr:hypothetical protein [Alphaproteobacteria bacterium]
MPARAKPVDWEAIRSAFERGESLAALSRRHAVSRQGITKRARREGWQRDEALQAMQLSASAARIANPRTAADFRLRSQGRRSPENAAAMVRMIREGATVRVAAAAVGISARAAQAWIEDDATLAGLVERAQAEAALRRIEQIEAASARGDWAAARFLIERSPMTRDDFRPEPRQQQAAAGSIQVHVHLNAEAHAVLMQRLRDAEAAYGAGDSLMPPAIKDTRQD